MHTVPVAPQADFIVGVRREWHLQSQHMEHVKAAQDNVIL